MCSCADQPAGGSERGPWAAEGPGEAEGRGEVNAQEGWAGPGAWPGGTLSLFSLDCDSTVIRNVYVLKGPRAPMQGMCFEISSKARVSESGGLTADLFGKNSSRLILVLGVCWASFRKGRENELTRVECLLGRRTDFSDFCIHCHICLNPLYT